MQNKKIVATRFGTDFRSVSSLVTVPLSPETLPERNLLIQIHYAGVNASDTNFAAGLYDRKLKPPFDLGFEGIGTIVLMGKAAEQSGKFKIGDAVALLG